MKKNKTNYTDEKAFQKTVALNEERTAEKVTANVEKAAKQEKSFLESSEKTTAEKQRLDKNIICFTYAEDSLFRVAKTVVATTD